MSPPRLPSRIPGLDLGVPPPPVVPRAKSAIVIVVEDNEYQAKSATWAGIHRAMAGVMDTGLGDIPGLPSWLRTLVRNSGSAARKLLAGIRKGFVEMVQEILEEARGVLGPSGGAGSLVGDLSETLLVPNGFQDFKNRYGEAAFAAILGDMAKPYYEEVVVLTDSTATFASFRATLERLNAEGFLIDVLLDVHGCGDSSNMNNGWCDDNTLIFADGDVRRRRSIGQHVLLTEDPNRPDTPWIGQINGGAPMSLNAVYMLSCWGSRFNQAWLSLGAKASNGPLEVNYYVLLSPFVFLHAWTHDNATLTQAAKRAYANERVLLNGRKFSVTIDLGLATWTFSVNLTWRKLMNRLLSKDYGLDKSKPVDNVASSARVGAGDPNARRA